MVAKVQSCVNPVGAEIDDVKVDYPDPWTVGQRMFAVCAIVDVDGLTGFTPEPEGASGRARRAANSADSPLQSLPRSTGSRTMSEC